MAVTIQEKQAERKTLVEKMHGILDNASKEERDEWIANMLSVSSVAHQPEEARDVFAKRLRELVPAERMVGRRVRTVAYWTRRV